MTEIIPMLPVEETCNWCEPQECYTASVWWGRCLLSFYTKDAARLAPDLLNESACEVLREITKALRPGNLDIIDPEELWNTIGQCGCLPCYWQDYRPPVLMGYGSSVGIPTPVAESST